MIVRTLFLAIATAAIAVMAAAGHAQNAAAPVDTEARGLEASLQQRLSAYGEDVGAAVWMGAADGPPRVAYNAAVVMPTASAIKTFYLVEFFAAHRDGLDAPLPDAAEFLHDAHPAVSHFAPAVRDEIRKELTTASVRRIGEVMMGKTDVSNAVYNAAANLITAQLGGPEQLTALIHARDPRFRTIMVRRYMLRDRTQPGDNEGTADAFAALYQSLATRRLDGIDDAVMSALHDVLRQRRPAPGGVLYEKDGGLSSDPLTSVRAGWQQTARGPIVFVVMCRQPKPAFATTTSRYDALRSLSLAIRDELLPSAEASR